MNDSLDTPASVLETRVVHNTHRAATTLLAEAAGRPSVPAAAVAGLRDFLVANLHHHHESEDDLLWPVIIKAAPHTVAALGELSGEHEQLDAALNALEKAEIRDGADGADRAACTAEAVAVRDLVHAHLDREEPLLLPALREYLSVDDWNCFAQHVKETTPMTGIHFLIGFVDKVASEEEAALMLGDLPAPALQAMREQARAAFAELGATT